jgi:hypothetical protein
LNLLGFFFAFFAFLFSLHSRTDTFFIFLPHSPFFNWLQQIVSGGQQMQIIRESIESVLGSKDKLTKQVVSNFAQLIRQAKGSGKLPSDFHGEDRLVFEKYQERLKFSCSIDIGDFLRCIHRHTKNGVVMLSHLFIYFCFYLLNPLC